MEDIRAQLNYFLACGDFYRVFITYANSLDPDQDRQNVGPDLDPNSLALIVYLKEFFEKLNFDKVSVQIQKHDFFPSMQSVKSGTKENRLADQIFTSSQSYSVNVHAQPSNRVRVQKIWHEPLFMSQIYMGGY